MIKVGILGLGTVGSGVVELLEKDRSIITKKLGKEIVVEKILVRNPSKQRPDYAKGKIVFNADEILNDPEIKVVVELIGGEEPAKTYIEKALKKGKHVITANKEVVSKYGKELLEIAKQQNVAFLFEASVAGGIPIIRPMKRCLAANRIIKIQGILNGTTNYILTQMQENKKTFQEALFEAQKLGYAESNPSADVKGFDAARKISILSSIAFNTWITPDKVYTEGIEKIGIEDIKYAAELGYVIKLIASARKVSDNDIEIMVCPTMINQNHPLSSVRGVYNAVLVEGDAVGEVMFFGQGAGKMATASAVVADIMEAASGKNCEYNFVNCDINVVDVWTCKSDFYIRLKAIDKSGVLAKISAVFGKNDISIHTVVQKDVKNEMAEIVILTHKTTFGNLKNAVLEIEKLDVVKSVDSVIKVEGGS
ncbi:homoserine dehydrogenase [Pseudothermotoga thermarum]|uniref:Homoserine dehydrogenase n=1 Tax=Pseudothermotoga thermarum DSM 5069 TaxID=688269 RepID=F7YW01_9THEM|nr:homoserine dehydrogenase [Pseudothermotoga thermarum]AEH50488.1 homoserine dehydrogenase [Pseudothermotoga thermarum DSM 5069]